jgi:F-box domain
MPSIPVDVLREILEHVDNNDLAILCRVNKIFCSCSQNVLYRKIRGGRRIIPTLVQSTDLARRVRSLDTFSGYLGLGTALRNMSSLRRLRLIGFGDGASILDGCTFKLDSFETNLRYSEPLQRFLNSQPSLTDVTLSPGYVPSSPFDESCLPNLTRVGAVPSWLGILIPGRPVTDVVVLTPQNKQIIDWNFFTLSTAPIYSLEIPCAIIYPTPESHLVSIFPSIVNLVLETFESDWSVRQQLIVMGVFLNKSTIIDPVGV